MRLLLTIALFAAFSNLFAQDFSVYLIGDAGEPKLPNDPILENLKKKLETASENDVLIFLGDNLYPVGLPDKEHPEREAMEQKLNASLDLIKEFKGRSFMVPGNHDWDKGKKNGWKQVLNMQEYVEDYLANEAVFVPGGGCPGPLEVQIDEKHTLLLIDTQYLLFPWDKPDETSECDAKSSSDALVLLNDILDNNKEKHVLAVGHHPMYSYGPHGGKYTFRQHMFPLSDINRKLKIPLPIIGSIYPIYRSTIGSVQDIPNPRYKLIRNAMVEAFSAVPNLVYAAGHEHSLQYLKNDDTHFVVSGAGSKSSPVKEGKLTEFRHEGVGFAELQYKESGDVELLFWDGKNGELLNQSKLYNKQVEVKQQEDFDFNFKDSTIVMPISDKYDGATKTRKLFLGENYRDVWSTPIRMKVFNIDEEHGGLKILKMGGGNQTKSLRLEDKDGKQYVLRSLDKYTDKLLPAALQRTVASDVLQDQISGANPFGAFAVPPLADAAGVYHANPQIVYIPDDPRFGQYRKIFSGIVCLYEERPNSKAASEPFFGSGKKVKGTPDVIEILHEDNDESVDQAFALRSRLFDMFLADWDRHEDQWRWVSKKNEYGHYWRPIPRDRDQAFFRGEGFISWFASRKFVLPNTEGFRERMRYPEGYNTSPRFFDRTFLSGLGWDDWKKQIDELQVGLTDEAIESAFDVWPDTIRAQVGEETIRILKARRDDMNRYARIHYLFLSKEVEVVGSDKKEHFLVERLNDDETKVTVWKLTKKKGNKAQVLYERVFRTDETKEIRLYGLDGEDVFELKGQVKKGIKVRIIGGTDKDIIKDDSKVSGLGKKTIVYDRKKSTEIESVGGTKSKLSKNPEINSYNRTGFKYNKAVPLISTEFNPDDGLFLGGGVLYTFQRWRKEPFASQHSLRGNFAVATGAFNLYYTGTFTDVIGKWDLNADLALQRPFGVDNFFGIGNETVFDMSGNNIPQGEDDPIDYYRIRYQRSQNYVNLTYNLGQKGLFRIGPEFMVFDVRNQNGRFINNEVNNFDFSIFDTYEFTGLRSDLVVDTRDNSRMTTRGIFGQLTYEKFFGSNPISEDFDRVSAEFSFYVSTRIPSKVTIANRVGAVHNFRDIDEIKFFNGARIGRDQLRGLRRSRFIGQSSFYHNVDLRLKLFSFRTYLLPGSLGLLGFHDTGRVWVEGENSDTMHTTKGFGIWLAPLNQIAINSFVAFGDDETQVLVSFGYHF